LFSVFVICFICVHVVPVFPQHIWPQSSVESDTDYEQHDISLEAAFPFSTFHS